MNKLILILSVFVIGSCTTSHSNKKQINSNKATDTSRETNEDLSEHAPIQTKAITPIIQDTISDIELIKKWTWKEKITCPKISSISNSTFPSRLLLKEWYIPKDDLPILKITKDSFNVYHQKFVYTVNFDSIRIFTKADHPGDGVDRGIITLINEDSLIIEWSTDDKNIYLTNNK